MIKTVVLEHHWAPSVVGALFIDGNDYESLDFHYDAIVKMHKELAKKKKTRS